MAWSYLDTHQEWSALSYLVGEVHIGSMLDQYPAIPTLPFLAASMRAVCCNDIPAQFNTRIICITAVTQCNHQNQHFRMLHIICGVSDDRTLENASEKSLKLCKSTCAYRWSSANSLDSSSEPHKRGSRRPQKVVEPIDFMSSDSVHSKDLPSPSCQTKSPLFYNFCLHVVHLRPM